MTTPNIQRYQVVKQAASNGRCVYGLGCGNDGDRVTAIKQNVSINGRCVYARAPCEMMPDPRVIVVKQNKAVAGRCVYALACCDEPANTTAPSPCDCLTFVIPGPTPPVGVPASAGWSAGFHPSRKPLTLPGVWRGSTITAISGAWHLYYRGNNVWQTLPQTFPASPAPPYADDPSLRRSADYAELTKASGVWTLRLKQRDTNAVLHTFQTVTDAAFKCGIIYDDTGICLSPVEFARGSGSYTPSTSAYVGGIEQGGVPDGTCTPEDQGLEFGCAASRVWQNANKILPFRVKITVAGFAAVCTGSEIDCSAFNVTNYELWKTDYDVTNTNGCYGGQWLGSDLNLGLGGYLMSIEPSHARTGSSIAGLVFEADPLGVVVPDRIALMLATNSNSCGGPVEGGYTWVLLSPAQWDSVGANTLTYMEYTAEHNGYYPHAAGPPHYCDGTSGIKNLCPIPSTVTVTNVAYP